jgi:hypothetical protein
LKIAPGGGLVAFTLANNKMKYRDGTVMMIFRGNPLPIFIGFLTFQVSGWFMGKTIFSSTNSEAMLVTFLAGGTIISGWLFFRLDEYSSNTSYVGRALWWVSLVIGVSLGLYCRYAI